jgi:hypothetical protein
MISDVYGNKSAATSTVTGSAALILAGAVEIRPAVVSTTDMDISATNPQHAGRITDVPAYSRLCGV